MSGLLIESRCCECGAVLKVAERAQLGGCSAYCARCRESRKRNMRFPLRKFHVTSDSPSRGDSSQGASSRPRCVRERPSWYRDFQSDKDRSYACDRRLDYDVYFSTRDKKF